METYRHHFKMVGIRGVRTYPSDHFALQDRLLIFPPVAVHQFVHKVAALLIEFGLMDILRHFWYSWKFRHMKTWSQGTGKLGTV